MERTDVVVVGGGIAGLAAAAFAGGRGRSVLLVEQSEEIGGRARTAVEPGADGAFRLNVGPHALYRHGAAARVLAELGVHLSGKVPPTAGTLAFHGGALHALPAGPGSLATTTLLPARGKLDLGRLLAALHAGAAARGSGTSVAAWLDARHPHPVARQVVEALFRVTTYASDPAELDAGAAIAQLRLGLRGVTYLDDGWASLVAALRARAEAAGARVTTGARATAIRQAAAGGLEIEVAGVGRIAARTAIVAGDPRRAAELLDGEAAAGLRAHAEGRVPVRAACLDLCLSRLPEPGRLFALGIDVPLYFSVHSASARLAPAGAAMIHVARYLGPSPHPDPAATAAELESFADLVQPGWRAAVVHRRLLPSLTVAHALPLARESGARHGVAVPAMPGLFVAGDWIGAEGMLADASLASAREAALAAVAALRAPAGRDQESPASLREASRV